MAIKTSYIKKGIFVPRNPQRYRGDPTKINYRSSWEAKVMLRLDTAPGIVWWASEEVVVPYNNPATGKPARYFPDFVVHLLNNDGDYETIMIEVKPARQTQPPKKPSSGTKDPKRLRNYAEAVMVYRINKAKWRSAEDYCKSRGWKFKLMTESNIL